LAASKQIGVMALIQVFLEESGPELVRVSGSTMVQVLYLWCKRNLVESLEHFRAKDLELVTLIFFDFDRIGKEGR
jgi:hypothetical protein